MFTFQHVVVRPALGRYWTPRMNSDILINIKILQPGDGYFRTCDTSITYKGCTNGCADAQVRLKLYWRHSIFLFLFYIFIIISNIQIWFLCWSYYCVYYAYALWTRNLYWKEISLLFRDIHHHETRGSVDLNVPYDRMDIRKFSLKISGARLSNSLPGYVKETNSLL